MCGKYDLPIVGTPDEIQIQKVLILEYIANELAESNRLERIKLEQEYTGLSVQDEA